MCVHNPKCEGEVDYHIYLIKHCDIYYKLMWQLFKCDHYLILKDDVVLIIVKSIVATHQVRLLFKVQQIQYIYKTSQ